MGQCLKFCEGTFCLKMVHSTAIFGQIFLILMLYQFSQSRKIRLERANLRKIIAKLNELFFRSFSSLRPFETNLTEKLETFEISLKGS